MRRLFVIAAVAIAPGTGSAQTAIDFCAEMETSAPGIDFNSCVLGFRSGFAQASSIGGDTIPAESVSYSYSYSPCGPGGSLGQDWYFGRIPGSSADKVGLMVVPGIAGSDSQITRDRLAKFVPANVTEFCQMAPKLDAFLIANPGALNEMAAGRSDPYFLDLTDTGGLNAQVLRNNAWVIDRNLSADIMQWEGIEAFSQGFTFDAPVSEGAIPRNAFTGFEINVMTGQGGN